VSRSGSIVVAPSADLIARIDLRTASRKAPLAFSKVPAVGDLKGVRERLGGRLSVTAASVARHDFDLGMRAEPGFDGGPLSIGQERHDTPPLQIADDRPVAMVAAEGPVVDADHAQASDVGPRTAPNDAQ
jgi:hypothetical protein